VNPKDYPLSYEISRGNVVFSSLRLTAVPLRSILLLLFASGLAHSSAVTVDPTVTSLGGGMYQYAYSISYTGADTAFLIDIPVPLDPAAITDLMAPAGFTPIFDSGLGLVSFLADSSFTAGPISGFSFDSSYGPGAAIFQTTLYDSSSNLYTLSGPTIAPVVSPEPTFLYLFAFMAPLILVLKRRHTKMAALIPQNFQPTETLYVSNS
jgi:hypothetical protein